MSDFFTRLAELSLGDARVIRPEIAPRFAQGPEVAPDVSQDSLWIDRDSEQTSAPKFSQMPAQLQSPEAVQETQLSSQPTEATDEETLSHTAAPEQPLNPSIKPPAHQTFSTQTDAKSAVEANAKPDAASSTEGDFARNSSHADVSTEARSTTQTPSRTVAAPPVQTRQEQNDHAELPDAAVSHTPAEMVLPSKETVQATDASPELGALKQEPLETDASATEPATRRTPPLRNENEKTSRPASEQSQKAQPEGLPTHDQMKSSTSNIESSHAVMAPPQDESRSTLTQPRETDAQAQGEDVMRASGSDADLSSHLRADAKPSGSEKQEKRFIQASTHSPDSIEPASLEHVGDQTFDSPESAHKESGELVLSMRQDETRAAPTRDGITAPGQATREQAGIAPAEPATTARNAHSRPEEMRDESQQEGEAPAISTKDMPEHQPQRSATAPHEPETDLLKTSVHSSTPEAKTEGAARQSAPASSAEHLEAATDATNRESFPSRERETEGRTSPVEIESGAENISGAVHDETPDQRSAPDAVTSNAFSADVIAPTPQHLLKQRVDERTPQKTTAQVDSPYPRQQEASDALSETNSPSSKVNVIQLHADSTQRPPTHETTHTPPMVEPIAQPTQPATSIVASADEPPGKSTSEPGDFKQATEDSARHPGIVRREADASTNPIVNPPTGRRPIEPNPLHQAESSGEALGTESDAIVPDVPTTSEGQYQTRIGATPARESSVLESSLSQPPLSARSQATQTSIAPSARTIERNSSAQPDSKDPVAQSSIRAEEEHHKASLPERTQHQDTAHAVRHEISARAKEEPSEIQRDEKSGPHSTQLFAERNAGTAGSSAVDPDDAPQPERDQHRGQAPASDGNEVEMPATPTTEKPLRTLASTHNSSTEAPVRATHQASHPISSRPQNRIEKEMRERVSQDSQSSVVSRDADSIPQSHSERVESGGRKVKPAAERPQPQGAQERESPLRRLSQQMSQPSSVSGADQSTGSSHPTESSRRNLAARAAHPPISSRTQPNSTGHERNDSLHDDDAYQTNAVDARSLETVGIEDVREGRIQSERAPGAQTIKPRSRTAQPRSHSEEPTQTILDAGTPSVMKRDAATRSSPMWGVPQQGSETVSPGQPDKVEQSSRALDTAKESGDNDSIATQSRRFQESALSTSEDASKGLQAQGWKRPAISLSSEAHGQLPQTPALQQGARVRSVYADEQLPAETERTRDYHDAKRMTRDEDGTQAETVKQAGTVKMPAAVTGRSGAPATPPERGTPKRPSLPHIFSAPAATPRPTGKSMHTERREMMEETTSSSRPIIRVNIGRIEVRAATPQKTSKPYRKPPPRPGLSLEDYLKRRKGGRR
ncbi:MAG: hypothetical protein QOC96_1625 [Acidobacteriota bacterium]|jgi:hypothetical protein|nr:hypothetical protein [Acidobacteriota bacterium]